MSGSRRCPCSSNGRAQLLPPREHDVRELVEHDLFEVVQVLEQRVDVEAPYVARPSHEPKSRAAPPVRR
jgi:hypothetical protein